MQLKCCCTRSGGTYRGSTPSWLEYAQVELAEPCCKLFVAMRNRQEETDGGKGRGRRTKESFRFEASSTSTAVLL